MQHLALFYFLHEIPKFPREYFSRLEHNTYAANMITSLCLVGDYVRFQRLLKAGVEKMVFKVFVFLFF